MSTADQEIDLTRSEAGTLRGAINVAEEVLERPEFDVAEQFPVTRAQAPVFERISGRINRRLEQFDADTITELLDPAEAQAVRDAVGLLEALLRDPGGRSVLVDVGFLVTADQPVDPVEREELETILGLLEPTGVRPGRTEPARAEGEIIDPTLSIEALVAVAGEEIANAEVPWAGFEQTKFSLLGTVDSFSGGRTTLSCEAILKNLIAVTKHAVAGGVRLASPDELAGASREIAGEFPVWVDDAFGSVMSSVETHHCVGNNAQETLWDRIDELVNRLTPGTSGENIRQAAQQLLVDLRAVAEPPEDFTVDGAEGPEGFGEDGVGDEGILRRIDVLRAELDDVRPVTTERAASDAIVALLPGSSADCGLLLLALAELAQLAYQVAIAEDEVPAGRFNSLKQAVDHNRRLILNKMGFDRAVVQDPIPGPRRGCFDDETFSELREALIAIVDPLEGDPDTAEERAYDALTLIREAFQDPRRP